MNMTPRMEHGLALLLVVLCLVPFGLSILISEEMPYRTVSGEPVKDAALAAGISVISVKDTTWNLPGATGGKIYTLSDENGKNVTISTQSFDSAESRDAAIRLHNAHAVGKGRAVGTLLVVGQHLVYITPANSPVLKDLAAELRKIAKS